MYTGIVGVGGDGVIMVIIMRHFIIFFMWLIKHNGYNSLVLFAPAIWCTCSEYNVQRMPTARTPYPRLYHHRCRQNPYTRLATHPTRNSQQR